jgi:dienelactone hydrolase
MPHARSFVLYAVSVVCAASGHTSTTFQSGGARVAIDEYSNAAGATETVAVILLCGSGGLSSSAVPYTKLAKLFARRGRRVYLPHYLDVTHGSASDPAGHYALWAQTVLDAMRDIQFRTGIPPSRIVIAGYSLGASVALAAGAQEPSLAGIIVWSGSLPDAYRDVNQLPPLLILHGGRDQTIPDSNARQLAELCTLKRFRCELNIYPAEDHAFSADGIARAGSQMPAFLARVLPAR